MQKVFCGWTLLYLLYEFEITSSFLLLVYLEGKKLVLHLSKYNKWNCAHSFNHTILIFASSSQALSLVLVSNAPPFLMFLFCTALSTLPFSFVSLLLGLLLSQLSTFSLLFIASLSTWMLV